MKMLRSLPRRSFSTTPAPPPRTSIPPALRFGVSTPLVRRYVGGGSDLIRELIAERKLKRETLPETRDAFRTEIDRFAELLIFTPAALKAAAKIGIEKNFPKTFEKKIDEQGWAVGAGGRKSGQAMVRLRKGTGVNFIRQHEDKEYKPFVEYFDEGRIEIALKPLEVTKTFGDYDVYATARGGGVSGQAGAVSLALARALQAMNPEYRALMKPQGLMTRDARKVERKKPGQKKARKKFQWVKR